MTPIAANRPARRPHDAEAGFSLIEIMVAVFIIGLLATIILINVLPSRDSAMVDKSRADLAVLEQALELYRLDQLQYPTTQQGLAALVTLPEGAARPELYREGGYIKRLPDDPWGTPYQYQSNAQGGFDLRSFGADGQIGGEGLNADIALGE